MRDYNYQDMLRMQEEAAVRVREMKKRAALAMEEGEEKQKKMTPIPDEVKHISYPVEIDDTINNVTEKQAEHTSGLLSFLAEDKDAILILSLVAVLSQENNDYMTTLALLYLLL